VAILNLIFLFSELTFNIIGVPCFRIGEYMTSSEELAFAIFIIMTVAFFIWVAYLAVKK
jgi:hypothetical protein